MNDIIHQFETLYKEIHEENQVIYPEEDSVLMEAKGLTLYDLRAFYSVMAETTDDAKLKSMLKSMVKTIAKMEVFKRKIPPIMRVKSPSPTVRSYTKN